MSTDNTLNDSTRTESPENADHDPNPDDTPAPTYEEPYKNTTNPFITKSQHSPLGKLYSGDVGDIVRATHLARHD